MKYEYRTANPDRYMILKDFARNNRNHPTEAENCLWTQLKSNQLGVKFQRQHIIFDYIADFICIEKKLIIEVDGGYHFVDGQIIKDQIRTENLNELGYRVLRFTNEEVICTPDNVINKIRASIK